jgi:hypothetical protein
MTNVYAELFHVSQAIPRLSGSRVGRIVAIEPILIVDFSGNPLGPQRARMAASLTREVIAHAYTDDLPVLLVFESDDPARPVIIDIVTDRPSRSASMEPAPTAEVRLAADHTAAKQEINVPAAGLARIVKIEADVVLLERLTEPTGQTFAARTAITLRNLKDPVVVLCFADGSAVIVGQVYPCIPVELDGGQGAEVVLTGSRVKIEADVELILQAGACRITLDGRGKAVTTADQIVSRARGANKVQGGSVQLN